MALPIDLVSALAVIAPGSAISAPVPLGSGSLVAVYMPPVWTAASLSYMVSVDGGVTYLEFQDGAGNPISNTASAGIAFPVNPATWRGINMLKIRSGTLAAPVIQAAGATITLQADESAA